MQTSKMELLNFTVVKGHQVASGSANDSRFPFGTINAQVSHFKALGLDISEFYPATINAEFNSRSITLNHHDYFFKQVKWHDDIPAEDFKFCRCILLKEYTEISALIYQPQFDTKTEHQQPLNQLEILAPYIEDIHYGDLLTLKINKHVITLSE
jgi:hypothetical protein|tara:strand:+ start:6375 stop:6836 length:462 start_codon:yes stop_codon:yes gene_type:complete